MGHWVNFKAFSGTGTGLRVIVLDLCKAQIDALGDYLIKYNDPTISGISEMNPGHMVEYIVKICSIHFDTYMSLFTYLPTRHTTETLNWAFRGVMKLEGKQVSKDALTCIWAVLHIKMQDELDTFKWYCETSQEKAVQGKAVHVLVVDPLIQLNILFAY